MGGIRFTRRASAYAEKNTENSAQPKDTPITMGESLKAKNVSEMPSPLDVSKSLISRIMPRSTFPTSTASPVPAGRAMSIYMAHSSIIMANICLSEVPMVFSAPYCSVR